MNEHIFSKGLLYDGSAYETVLRKISSTLNQHMSLTDNLLNNVQEGVFESEISLESLINQYGETTSYDYRGYNDDDKKHFVLKKLMYLNQLIDESEKKSLFSSEKTFIQKCISHVESGWALTEKITNSLNEIYESLRKT